LSSFRKTNEKQTNRFQLTLDIHSEKSTKKFGASSKIFVKESSTLNLPKSL